MSIYSKKTKTILKELGQAIATKRRGLGMAQSELSTRSGTSRLTIRSIEAGKPGVAVGTVFELMHILGMTVSPMDVGKPLLGKQKRVELDDDF